MRSSLDGLAQHATLVVALGGTLSTLSYAVWVVRGVQAKMEVLEQKLITTEGKLEQKIITTEQKIITTEEKIDKTEVKLEQKIITTEEKIKTAKVEAIKESTENYMKYNHSAEFSSLQKSNASRGAE